MKSYLSEKLVNEQKNLFKIALKFTRDKDEANDLVQETSLKVLDNYNKYHADISFKSWIFIMMRNIFFNDCVKKKRVMEHVIRCDDIYNLGENSCLSHNDTETSIELNQINGYIESLKPELKEVFLMHIAGYKYNDIAEKMNIPIGTVKSRIHKSRSMLKENMKR